jgi:5-hydroxyisourate hydrolase-like protein (transthyretin family)
MSGTGAGRAVTLSTHVLDTGTGRPAAGVPVDVLGADGPVGTLVTDADGRARLDAPLAPGTYRLAFHPPSPFFTRVELQVELAEGHYHVPLLVSPFGCASYRGS